MAVTRSTCGAKLHDDFADGDATNNPTWTSESGSMAVSSGEFHPGAPNTTAFARSAVTINNSDLISWRAKILGLSIYTTDVLRVDLSDTARNNFYEWALASSSSNLSKRVAGVDTVLTSFNDGVANSSYHTYAIKWNGSSLRLYVDDAEIAAAAATDSAFTTHAAIRLLSLSLGDGASAEAVFDDVCVMDGWTVTCAGLPTGWKLRVISDSGGTAVATATESSGTATVDLTGKCAFPYYGVQVLDGSNVVQDTLVPSATVSGHSVSGAFGGDAYAWGTSDSPSGAISLSGSKTEAVSYSDFPSSPASVADHFSTDTSADYWIDTGSAPVVSSGTLKAQAFGSEQLWLWKRSSAVADRTATIKTHLSTAATGAFKGITARRIDASNFLLVHHTNSHLEIVKKDGGSYSVLALDTSFSLADGADCWLKAVFSGNAITATLYSDSAMTAVIATKSYTLAGADATKFGAVTSRIGLRWNGGSSSDSIDDLTDDPASLLLKLTGSASESQTHGGPTFSDSASGTVTLSGSVSLAGGSHTETPTATITLLPTGRRIGIGWISLFEAPIDSYSSPVTGHPTGTLALSGSVTESWVNSNLRLTVSISDSSVTDLEISDAPVNSLVLSDAAV